MIKGMLKLGVALALFAGTACVSLAVVYSVTGPVIKSQQEKDLKAALKDIFPDAEDFTEITQDLAGSDPKITILNGYAMKKGGHVVGVAVKAAGPSYSGNAVVLSGIGTDKKVVRVIILELLDTPGLGANAANPNYFVDKPNKITFTGQFAGKEISDPFEAKKDVQAITASTITTRAIASIVKAAGTAAAEYLVKTGGAK
jgi:electron transport complex protein RnfG